ncbi:ethanolamine utilization protein EutJ [Clostridium sp. D2Q-14]|uniref:ethanolamine utilization protein EutJ n=1 Tax=Anaeromonas gelatinilytica TaxID=2683194 RepID=UPI00193C3245|nr:ethanolamine utilization protein EutJ [Anaeromonas gelatinilytica]MBS4534539.1 ethanolamine utilization protein EutJ [Anaeromonas gelatinilytica]
MNLSYVNEYIEKFNSLIVNKDSRFKGENLKIGIDLGTANIVLAVVDEKGDPIAGASREANVVKDGLVVDYVKAIDIVKELKLEVETILGRDIKESAVAIPPGTLEGNTNAIVNVVESVGIEVINVVDEPTAAASVLKITDGAVVDIGGGTTGISILKDGEVIYVADEPTGGTHMTLVLSGSYGLSFDEAENMKKDVKREKEVFTIIRPVIEKMADIVKRHISNYSVNKIYIVGGACSFSEFEDVFTKYTGIESIKPSMPLLVTPLGIALNCKREEKYID